MPLSCRMHPLEQAQYPYLIFVLRMSIQSSIQRGRLHIDEECIIATWKVYFGFELGWGHDLLDLIDGIDVEHICIQSWDVYCTVVRQAGVGCRGVEADWWKLRKLDTLGRWLGDGVCHWLATGWVGTCEWCKVQILIWSLILPEDSLGSVCDSVGHHIETAPCRHHIDIDPAACQ